MPLSGVAEVSALLSLINNAAQAALSQYAAHEIDVPSFYAFERHPLDSARDNLGLRTAIKTLEGACYQLCATLAPPSHTLYKNTSNHIRDCLSFALEAKVADIIAEHPNGIHVSQIAPSVGAEEDKLDRILRYLSSKSYFCEVSPHVYAPSRLTLPMLSTTPTYVISYIPSTVRIHSVPAFYSTITSPTLGRSYEAKDAPFMQSINSKISSEKDKYSSYYHWIGAQQVMRDMFEDAMVGVEMVLGRLNILHHYPWNSIKTVCDVGSGVGGFSLALTRRHPHVNITLFDLPGVIEQAAAFWGKKYPEALRNSGGTERIAFSPGDFTREIKVQNQDIYFLRNILHNWSDEKCRMILTNVRQAMKGNPNSRVLIHDFVIQYALPPKSNKIKNCKTYRPSTQAPYPLLSNYGAGNMAMYNMDIAMLLTLNGQERTLDKTLGIAKDSGLEFVRIWETGETLLLELKETNIKTRL